MAGAMQFGRGSAAHVSKTVILYGINGLFEM